MAFRIVHYLNQFFGRIGGEKMAHTPPAVTEGPVGPGLAFTEHLAPAGEIVATIACGDNFMAENPHEASHRVIDRLNVYKPCRCRR